MRNLIEPPQPSDEVNDAVIASIDNMYDYLKHLTTINTGTIVILFALLDKTLKNQSLITISLILFGISLIFALFGMGASIVSKFILRITIYRKWSYRSGLFTGIGLWNAIFAFVGGIVLLLWVVVNNWR